MELSFKNKTVLITGGTRGIGKSIAEVFEKAGASLILTGTKPGGIDKFNQEYGNSNRFYHTLDFSSPESVDSFLSDLDDYKSIDVCINNAGINIIEEFIETKTTDFDVLMDINLKGPYLLNKYCAKRMKENLSGRIVNICSIWSEITRPGRSLYTMAKNALHGLTQTMAVELAQYNIMVNSVSPGFTLTDLTKLTNTKEELMSIEEKIPARRMALPEEIANVVVFLSSDQNSYLTGQNIVVDGGYVIV